MDRILDATFDATLKSIMWALEESAQISGDSVDERFKYKEIVTRYSSNIDKHQVKVRGKAQAIMFLCSVIAGGGEDYLSSVETIISNTQLNGKWRNDYRRLKKGETCEIDN